jgi:hypothetical protein
MRTRMIMAFIATAGTVICCVLILILSSPPSLSWLVLLLLAAITIQRYYDPAHRTRLAPYKRTDSNVSVTWLDVSFFGWFFALTLLWLFYFVIDVSDGVMTILVVVLFLWLITYPHLKTRPIRRAGGLPNANSQT